MKNVRRDARFNFKTIAVFSFIAASMFLITGCTRNASSEWAQTAPIIKADATMGNGYVSLGAKK